MLSQSPEREKLTAKFLLNTMVAVVRSSTAVESQSETSMRKSASMQPNTAKELFPQGEREQDHIGFITNRTIQTMNG